MKTKDVLKRMVIGIGWLLVVPFGLVSLGSVAHASPAIGDLNEDGTPDFAVLNTIYLGASDGTFGAPTALPIDDDYATSGAIGDINGDGNLDLAVTIAYGGIPRIALFLGAGDGTFGPPAYDDVGAGMPRDGMPTSVALGDFNGDQNLDLAVASYYNSFGAIEEDSDSNHGVWLRFGMGDGTFGDPKFLLVDGVFDSSSVAADDLDGDGDLDLAVDGQNSILIFLGEGDGTFGPDDWSPFPVFPWMSNPAYDWVSAPRPAFQVPDINANTYLDAIGDLDGDGSLDLAHHYYGDNIQMSPGIGDGTFGPPAPFPPGSLADPYAIGDLDNDGSLDIAVVADDGEGGPLFHWVHLCGGLLPVTILGTAGDDTLTGTSGPDVISGLGGNDIIRGRGGNDVICGGGGIDYIQGGDGNDRLYGGGMRDYLMGDKGNDVLFGGDGGDLLRGGNGDDRLYGENGVDNLRGGNGSDFCDVGPPNPPGPLSEEKVALCELFPDVP